MALLPHVHFPRSLFDMDQWIKTPHPNGVSTTLDLFDPFDELDHMIGRNMQWLNKPEFLPQFPLMPRVPQKYRITVECAGYKPESIKTEWVGTQLVVSAREEDKHENHDYSIREFKKTFDFPPNAEHEKLVSFLTKDGGLVLEVPLKETEEHPNSQLFPRVVDNSDGTKSVSLQFNVPKSIHPEKIHVSLKDRDLIVRAEDRIDKPDRHSKFFFYKRTTLPENTKFSDIKVVYDNHQISLTAPLETDWSKLHKSIPIEHKPAIKH